MSDTTTTTTRSLLSKDKIQDLRNAFLIGNAEKVEEILKYCGSPESVEEILQVREIFFAFRGSVLQGHMECFKVVTTLTEARTKNGSFKLGLFDLALDCTVDHKDRLETMIELLGIERSDFFRPLFPPHCGNRALEIIATSENLGAFEIAVDKYGIKEEWAAPYEFMNALEICATLRHGMLYQKIAVMLEHLKK